MGAPVPPEALAWAARPGAAALLRAARERLDTGRAGPRSALAVTAQDRADVGRLFGVRWESSGKDVTLQSLRDALGRLGCPLEELLVNLDWPLRNAAAERAQAKGARAQHFDTACGTLILSGVPEPVAALALRWLGPAAGAPAVAEVVARAWAALPARPGEDGPRHGRPVGLAAFAGHVLGDPHALDRDQTAGRALARTIAASSAFADARAAARTDDEAAAAAAVTAAAEALLARSWRATFARVGLVCDQVSSTVLVLNLPLSGPNPALGAVTVVAGEPLWVTSSMTAPGCKVSSAPPAASPFVVRVCENPSVVEAAAAELGTSCPPMVCVYGRPSSAAWDVLEAVVAAGGQLLVSGDRDDAGAQISDEILRADRVSGRLWLADAAGLYEEERLPQLLSDLASSAGA